jgi:hypothetical protein
VLFTLRERSNMRRVVVFVVLLVLAGVALVPAAIAEKPIRSFLPAGEPFVLDGPCAFPVRVEVLTNKEFGTEYSDGRFLITGSFKVRLTNLAPGGSSMDVNISGPGVLTPTPDGGSKLTSWGNWLFWFFPGDLGLQSPGRLLFATGHGSEVFDADGKIVSVALPRNTTDACAALA